MWSTMMTVSQMSLDDVGLQNRQIIKLHCICVHLTLTMVPFGAVTECPDFNFPKSGPGVSPYPLATATSSLQSVQVKQGNQIINDQLINPYKESMIT